MNRTIIASTILVVSLLSRQSSLAGLSAPLPDFKSPAEFAKIHNAESQKSKLESKTNPATSTFYTGKVYDSSLNSYVFAYRLYNADQARWTNSDPSGFPDGANNHLYACNTPICGLDSDGLIFLRYTGGTSGELQVWSGQGHKSDGSVDWGTKSSTWAAVSGGADDTDPIPYGWWSVGSSQTLGTPDDNPPAYEADWHDSGGWHQGAMSAWSSTGRDGGHTQYKYALSPIFGNNTDRTGIKIHPDGPTVGVTHGCIGISGYDNAVSVRTFLQNNSGLTLLVE